MKVQLFIIFAIVTAAHSTLQAQSLPSPLLSADFSAEVKSLEEFQARFNGKESKPGIKEDAESRRNNIINLFDFNISKGGLDREQFTNKINDFVDSVLLNNIEFRITGVRLWVECICKVKFRGEEKKITLILQSEEYKKNRYRWAIVTAKGLEGAGILSTDRLYPISPVEHEVHFMGLQDLLNENPTHAFGYRYKGATIDPLSVFLSMVMVGALKFEMVEEQSYHYFDVPGYALKLNELNRSGANRGWLITAFDKVSETEKRKRINNLLGYE